MASSPPIPQKVLVTDGRGYVSQPWMKWFLYILERSAIAAVPADLTALTTRVTTAESNITTLQSTSTSHGSRITALEAGGGNVFELYQTNEVDDAGGGVTYVGKATTAGKYLIEKLTDTAGDISKVYANISNNGAVPNFTTAWTNRLTLTYGQIQTITGV